MELFSTRSGDSIPIDSSYYSEFVEETSRYYDKAQINDLVYYLYSIYEELEIRINKRTLLLRASEILRVISIEDMIGLKPFELQRMLKSPAVHYAVVYDNILSGFSEKVDPQ